MGEMPARVDAGAGLPTVAGGAVDPGAEVGLPTVAAPPVDEAAKVGASAIRTAICCKALPPAVRLPDRIAAKPTANRSAIAASTSAPATGGLRCGDIVEVIDAAKGAGVEKVGIITEGMRRREV